MLRCCGAAVLRCCGAAVLRCCIHLAHPVGQCPPQRPSWPTCFSNDARRRLRAVSSKPFAPYADALPALSLGFNFRPKSHELTAQFRARPERRPRTYLPERLSRPISVPSTSFESNAAGQMNFRPRGGVGEPRRGGRNQWSEAPYGPCRLPHLLRPRVLKARSRGRTHHGIKLKILN